MEIRDNRQKEWFWLDNEYLNGYARFLGETCTVVYLSLCRHADNKTQTCFPSMELIAEENGIGRKKVGIALQKLKEWGVISIKEDYDPKNKRRKNNVYTLLSKIEWREKPCVNLEHGSPMCQNDTDPCVKNDKSHVSERHSNNTHINNTQLTIQSEPSSQEIPLILKEFESLNPACKNFYGNRTQRKATQDLIDTHGFDRVIFLVREVLPKSNKVAYMPNITTPVQLRDGYAKLENALHKHKSSQNNKYQSTVV